jgi:hypothetical protein
MLLPKAASGSVLVPCPDNNYSSSPSFPLAAATVAWTLGASPQAHLTFAPA